MRPLFFSGCPVACRQAREALPGIETWEIDKFPDRGAFDAALWRKGLAEAAARALNGPGAEPFSPAGPFDCVVTMRDGPEYARALSRRWGLQVSGARILIRTDDIRLLYKTLVRLCYLTPFLEILAPAALPVYGLIGRFGLCRARGSLRRRDLLA